MKAETLKLLGSRRTRQMPWPIHAVFGLLSVVAAAGGAWLARADGLARNSFGAAAVVVPYLLATGTRPGRAAEEAEERAAVFEGVAMDALERVPPPPGEKHRQAQTGANKYDQLTENPS